MPHFELPREDDPDPTPDTGPRDPIFDTPTDDPVAVPTDPPVPIPSDVPFDPREDEPAGDDGNELPPARPLDNPS